MRNESHLPKLCIQWQTSVVASRSLEIISFWCTHFTTLMEVSYSQTMVHFVLYISFPCLIFNHVTFKYTYGSLKNSYIASKLWDVWQFSWRSNAKRQKTQWWNGRNVATICWLNCNANYRCSKAVQSDGTYPWDISSNMARICCEKLIEGGALKENITVRLSTKG